MDFFFTVVLSGLATTFVISALEFWYALHWLRGFVALGLSGLGLAIQGDTFPLIVVHAAAAAFISLAILLWLERPQVAVRGGRR